MPFHELIRSIAPGASGLSGGPSKESGTVKSWMLPLGVGVLSLSRASKIDKESQWRGGIMVNQEYLSWE